MKLAHVTALALALPGTHEEPHFEAQSFRVGKRIFATVPPGGEHLHVFLTAEDVAAAIDRAPRAATELRWGAQLAGVRIVLASAEAAHVDALLVTAWRRIASKRLLAAYDAARRDA